MLVRVIADFRLPEDGDEDWRGAGQKHLETALAEHGLISPADDSDGLAVMEQLTTDMSSQDLANFKLSVRYLARKFGGPVASISVLRNGYVRLRVRSSKFESLFETAHGVVTTVMERHEADGWELRRCEIRERGGEDGFLFGDWAPGVRQFWRYLFNERLATFIVTLFGVGLLIEASLSFVHPSASAPGALAGTTELLVRLGAPMLISSTVLILERYAQFLDQRRSRLLWSARPQKVELQQHIYVSR
jgi:hypothetical protein